MARFSTDNSGFLGKQHASFPIDQSLLGEDVKIRAIQPVARLTTIRLRERKRLRDEFQAFRRIVDVEGETHALDASYTRALNLLSSNRTQEAFELGK